MSVDYLPVPNDGFTEDVATAGNGSVLVSRPCQVWQVIIIGDTSQAGVINFSNSSTAYDGTKRKFKAALASGQFTQSISFPHGLNCTSGLSAISNIAGIDVFVSYD